MGHPLFLDDYELNAVIYDKRGAGALEAAFDADRRVCRRFEADAYRAGPFPRRRRDSAVRLVSPLM